MKRSEAGFSYVADYGEIEEKEFSLAVNRYVENSDIAENKEMPTFDELLRTWSRCADNVRVEIQALLSVIEGRD